jgi:hypothetical protein
VPGRLTKERRFVLLRPRNTALVATLTLAAAPLALAVATPAALAAPAPAVTTPIVTAPAVTTPAVTAASVSPEANPPANFTPPQPLCADATPSCNDTNLADINAARAHEGVVPMGLPSNYDTLSGAQQELVIINAERSGRGLSTFAALDPQLSAAAQAAAANGSDPAPPAGYPWDAYGSIFASTPSALYADYLWMYDDGYGPNDSNLNCPSAGAPGCWGHRDNILGNWAIRAGDQPELGTGAAGGDSWAALFVSATGAPTPAGCPTSDGARLGSGTGITSVDIGSCPGYYVTDSAGQAAAFGAAAFQGDLSGVALNAPIIAITATPDGGGYWLLGADGGIFSFGDAGFYGSTGNLRLNAPLVGMAAGPGGGGYWIVAKDGGVFSFGDATFHGSTGTFRLNQPVDGIAAGPGGQGYRLVASDGGVFDFGEPFDGSLGSVQLNRPIIGISGGAAGQGYTLVASDGGVFNFDTPFYGSLAAEPPSTPVVALSTTPDGLGYYLLDAAGEVFAFGDAVNLGDA